MRVRGNVSPAVIILEPYHPKPGYAELRLRENVREISEIDKITEQTIVQYEYDEYTFLLKEKDGLKAEIEANLNDWLVTGRTLEVNEYATIMQDMKDAGAKQMKLYCATGNTPSADSGVFADRTDAWEAGKEYKKNDIFSCNGSMGFVKQAHTSQAHWIPFTTGTESLYGARPAPDAAGVYPYVYNMAAEVGMKVLDPDNGMVYVCIQNIPDMLYKPHDIPAHFVVAE